MVRRRILIVDDDRDFADSVADILELRGHDVTVAYSADSAIAKFDDCDFDLAFVDFQMPGKNGVECFMEIRRLGKRADFVIMTGHSVPALVDEALVNGALGILSKPLDIYRLLEFVERD